MAEPFRVAPAELLAYGLPTKILVVVQQANQFWSQGSTHAILEKVRLYF